MSKDALMLTYSNILTVKTRGVFQIVLEAPIEDMQEAMELLGPPISSSEVWVAVARMKQPGEAPKPQEALPAPREFKLAAQAAMLCNDPGFQRWMDTDAEGAADALRLRCGIKSRAELDTDATAARAFKDMRADFKNWLAGVEA